MAWIKDPRDGEYRYENSSGEVVARVRLTGIKGRWRWRSHIVEAGKRNPGCGTAATDSLARSDAEDFLRRVGSI